MMVEAKIVAAKVKIVEAKAVQATAVWKLRNSFVVNIMTSKPLALNILQTTFANPAPVKGFRGVGGRGVPPKIGVS
jgi:hypothetical protein